MQPEKKRIIKRVSKERLKKKRRQPAKWSSQALHWQRPYCIHSKTLYPKQLIVTLLIIQILPTNRSLIPQAEKAWPNLPLSHYFWFKIALTFWNCLKVLSPDQAHLLLQKHSSSLICWNLALLPWQCEACWHPPGIMKDKKSC